MTPPAPPATAPHARSARSEDRARHGRRHPRAARPRSAGAFGAQLREQARLQLTINQLERYQALFARAAEQPDRHARYHARVLLLEEGLAAAGQTTSQTQAAHLFVAVATAALDALEEDPREPILLNYAGVALYELWSLEAAYDLFKAASRLDPALPHLQRNLKELGRRRKGHRPNRARSTSPSPASPPAPASWPPRPSRRRT